MEKIDEMRAKFVYEVISILEEALIRNLLSFKAVRTMNYEEVCVSLSYNEYCIVLGRADKRQESRPYAADHTFRICSSNGDNLHWFEPFVLNDSTDKDQSLKALRDRLAGLHKCLMDAAPKDESQLSDRLFNQNRFLRRMRDSLCQTPIPA